MLFNYIQYNDTSNLLCFYVYLTSEKLGNTGITYLWGTFA